MIIISIKWWSQTK